MILLQVFKMYNYTDITTKKFHYSAKVKRNGVFLKINTTMTNIITAN